MAGSLLTNTQPQNVPATQQEQNGPGRNTTVGHDQVVVEDITEVAGGPVLRLNPATTLELQQLMRVMETMAQTMATPNAQINERFDRWRIGRPVYRRPYPEHFDQEEFPRGFKVPDFALFSGDGLQSIVEHIGRFTAQCAEIGHREALKLRLFPSTLTGAAFSWYVKLPQNSVLNWQVMEQVFHEQFYRPEPEVSMADLAKIS
ncbi:PREDICTED: uncharacterized protein LOC103322219 [Prunus mume]|uniref:Uncharacterized protein LOC103322219 n=1 Tax=Prunus mume TaxID=102107 RepID=A0ABM0NBM7_PRUMU|nr:PREDICTED: uncharacterized protein LOC103322219 [Prunus mume]